MNIRMLNPQEISPALHLAWDVFCEDVAPSYTQEGVGEFKNFIEYNRMMQSYQNREILFFGAFEQKMLVGMIAFKRDGHICLFFVRKDVQGRGIGRGLFQVMCNYCLQVYGVNKITVNAAPGSVEKYMHMGMYKIGEEEEQNGIRSVPLEMKVTESKQFMQTKKTSKAAIIGIIAASILLLLVSIIGIISLAFNLYDEVKQEEMIIQEYPEEDDYWYDEENPDADIYEEYDEQEDDLSGINGISAYIDENLSYEIKEEMFTAPDQETQNTYIDFQIKYPQISGIDSKTEKKINTMIEECAMETVEKIYDNPSDEIKERVLSSDYPVLVSYVEYKVCYANDEFISIVFQDESCQGTTEDYHCNLRTLNISLEDGSVYEVKDIVEINDQFVDEWLDIMQDETGDSEFLSELSEKELKKALKGESPDGEYVVNFFVSDGKIEIGFDLNYSDDSSANSQYAWVTAPFELNKIHKYAIDGEFWGDL